jgi:hypothetical protein
MSYDSEVLADTPAGYWKLDETSGTSAVDSSGNGNNGTYIGGITLNNRTLADGTKCPDFNGSTGYVNLGTPTALNFKDVWSLEAWVIEDVLATAEKYIISEGYNGGSTAIYYAMAASIGLGSGGTGKIGTGVYDGSWRTLLEPTAPTAGTLYHYVATHDGTNMRVYRNGLLVAGPTAAAVAGNISYTNVSIGARQDPGLQGPWDGGIGRVAIYHSVLSDSRIATHFTAGGGTIAPTVARVYHEFSEAVVGPRPNARVYHEFDEAIIRVKAAENVYHQYAEVLVRTVPDERIFHQFAEVITQRTQPIRNYHQFAEVIVGPPGITTLMDLG